MFIENKKYICMPKMFLQLMWIRVRRLIIVVVTVSKYLFVYNKILTHIIVEVESHCDNILKN